ncbi:hypothetical protein QJS10_CPA08g00306 [Acorus calamus]|uniref:RING-type domain-containing protein n=1 Tax=Acorus calamus TaxID=4465 RepID=A0AAV9EAV6_ACOCL|nr:hypothetical protein QJS10_CPA08g00306 [Acorus calamus]
MSSGSALALSSEGNPDARHGRGRPRRAQAPRTEARHPLSHVIIILNICSSQSTVFAIPFSLRPLIFVICKNRWCNQQQQQQQQQQSERKVLLERKDSARDVCAVCLDGFGAEQDVTRLPCSHRYHSDCLMPWLTKHSDCPCCRKVVLT